MRQSERSKPNLLPRFPRLSLQRQRREIDLTLERDDPEMTHFFALGRNGQSVMLPSRRY